MGLASINLNEHLKHHWRTVLAEHGLRVTLEGEEHSTIKLREAVYVVSKGDRKLRLLEGVMKWKPNEPAGLVVLPGQSSADYLTLGLFIQAALQASGATKGNCCEKIALFTTTLANQELVQALNIACQRSGLALRCRATACPHVLTFESTEPDPACPTESIDVYVVRRSLPAATESNLCLAIRVPDLIESRFGRSLRSQVLKLLRSMTTLEEI